jgi:hypothetical protein
MPTPSSGHTEKLLEQIEQRPMRIDLAGPSTMEGLETQITKAN